MSMTTANRLRHRDPVIDTHPGDVVKIAQRAGVSGLIADELVVGILPPFAVGQGKE
jgi:hypothetical protein